MLKKDLGKIISLILFIILLLLPFISKLDYRYLGQGVKITYGLMFQYFITKEVPLNPLPETPKPLVAFLYYFLPAPSIYLLLAFLISIGFFYFVKMSEQISGYSLAGALAYLYVLFVFEDSHLNLLSCYWLWLYLPLVIMAFYHFFSKKFLKYSLLMGLSGLIRPDSWFFAGVIFLYAFFKKLPKRALFLIPFLAPILWLGFDAKTFNNPFYSYFITARYPVITGLLPVNFFQYFPVVFRDLANLTGNLFLLVGFIGAFFTLYFTRYRRDAKKRTEERKTGYVPLFLFTFAPFVLYLLLSLRGGVLPMRRFFLLPLLFFAFYLLNLPNLFFKEKKLKLFFTLVIFIFFLLLNISFDRLGEVYRGIKDEEAKMRTVEASLTRVREIIDSLAAVDKKPDWIIVPFRRKAVFEYHFPSYRNKIESFREIAALKKEIKNYPPALVYFLKADFAGLEYIFNFLTQKQVHLLKNEGVTFTPVFSSPWFIIYLLEKIGGGR